MWKGQLVIGREKLPVRMYSAVRDTTVHFRLLARQGHAPVRQRIVRKTDHEEVSREDQRKAFVTDEGQAVILTAEELKSLEPEESRDIELCRFVPRGALDDPWYDRPYYLGPGSDKDEKRYFALVEALGSASVIGAARWAMRRNRYVGALTVFQGHLMMVTLRRAEQIVAVPEVSVPHKPDPKEVKLATQLVDAFAGAFDAAAWQDEYHDRVCKLIEAKAKGRKLEVRTPKAKRARGGLAGALRKSIESAKREHAHA